MSSKLVCGVGINSGKYKAKVNGKWDLGGETHEK